MTSEELQTRIEYQALTSLQQKFVDMFLKTNDSFAAVKAACNCTSEASFKERAFRLMRNPRIVACINLARGLSPEQVERAQFDAALERAISNPKTTCSQIKALQILAESRGYFPKVASAKRKIEEAAGKPQYAIGDMVAIGNGRFLKVVEILKNGTPRLE